MKLKKIISCITTAALSLSIASFSVASADNIGDYLIFDLDLTNYNDTTQSGLSDSSDSNMTVEINESTRANISPSVTKGEMDNLKGEKIPYVEMQKTTTANISNRPYTELNWIRVQDERLKSTANGQTLEVWLRASESTVWSSIMDLAAYNSATTYSKDTAISKQSVGFGNHSKTKYFMSGVEGGDQSFLNAAYKGKWTHVAMSKSFDEDTDIYTVVLYINGQQVATKSTTSSHTPVEEKAGSLVLGAGRNVAISNNSTCNLHTDAINKVDFAEAKVYSRAASDDEISALYTASKDIYTEAPKSLALEEISQGSTDGTLKVGTNFREIVLKFNNCIDDATLDEVTFEGEGVANLQKDLSADKKTITITFDELTDGEEYTLTIGGGLTSLNGYTIGEDVVYPYEIDGDLNKLNIVSHNTETTYTLLPGAKKLEIEFNFEFDELTLENGIRFANADGTSIPGGYSVEAGEDDTKAIITFGRLRMGDYILSTNANLKAKEDGINTRIAQWSFKVETDDDAAIVEGNFEGFDEGEIADTELEEDNVSYGNSGTQSDKYVIEKTENGVAYVVGTGSQAEPGGSISITLPEAVTSGKLAVDMTFKAVGGSIKRNLFTVRNSNNNRMFMLQINDSNIISKNNEKNMVNGEFTDAAYTTDEDGFYNLRVVFLAADETADWTVLVYDKLTSMTEPIYKGKMGRVYDAASSTYGLSNISAIVLYDVWWVTGNPASGAGVAVKDYSVRMLPVPQVMSSNTDYAEPDIDSIELLIDSDIIESEVSNESVTLKNDDGDVITADVSYNSAKRLITLTPKAYLEYDTEYEVEFENLLCETYSFTTNPRSVYLDSAPALIEVNGTKAVGFSVRTTLAAAKVYVIANVFDDSGNLVKTVGSGAFSAGANSPLTDELLLEGVELGDGYKVKVFIWGSNNSLIYPLCSPIELTN